MLTPFNVMIRRISTLKANLGGNWWLVVALCFGIVSTLGYVGARHFTIKRAAERLQVGLPTIAFESLRPYRWTMYYSADNCRLLATSAFQARKSSELNYIAEACMEAKIQIPEIYLTLAGMREWEGRDQEAAQILSQAARTFEKVGEVHLNFASMARKLKQEGVAVQEALKAAEVAGQNSQLQLEALQFLILGSHWKEAKPVADQLRSVATEEPAVKLLLARVYAKNQDETLKQALVNEATSLLAKSQAKPEQKEAIKRAFADVLGGASGSADNNSDGASNLAQSGEKVGDAEETGRKPASVQKKKKR